MLQPITVWRVRLDAPIDQAAHLLSPDEKAHARKLGPAEVASRWVASRAALRTILADHLRLVPTEISFAAGLLGKPELAGGEVEFNLSHSEDTMLLAIAPVRVGIDIERRRAMPDYPQLARHFFSPRERDMLDALAPEQRHDAFFRCWCHKEAYIKGRGDGLSHDLESFSVELRPGQPAALLESLDDERWTLFDIDMGQRYSAALAVEGSTAQYQLKDWSPVSA